MKYFSIILLVFLVSCNTTERIKFVLDGDTVVTDDNQHLRIYQIDAPERKQFYGKEAKAFTESLLLGQDVKVIEYGKDKYGRKIATIIVKGQDFSDLIVKAGLAHVSAFYCHNEQLINEYKQAKENRRGLFAYNWILPSQFRKTHRQ